MSAQRHSDKKTQTDQVRSKVISVCLFILKNGEFDDLSYKVIKQKRNEESVVITYNNLFGILGENVDPLSISLSCSGICKVLILFCSLQTYNLVNKGSFDASLFLDILRQYHRNTVFCPGIPKRYFENAGQTNFENRLAQHVMPFPRYQANECTVVYDRPSGVLDLLRRCKACRILTNDISSVFEYETSNNINVDSQNVAEERNACGDKNEKSTDYSCLKNLLRKNTKSCLIVAEKVDHDLDGNFTVGLRLSKTSNLNNYLNDIPVTATESGGSEEMTYGTEVMYSQSGETDLPKVSFGSKHSNKMARHLPCDVLSIKTEANLPSDSQNCQDNVSEEEIYDKSKDKIVVDTTVSLKNHSKILLLGSDTKSGKSSEVLNCRQSFFEDTNDDVKDDLQSGRCSLLNRESCDTSDAGSDCEFTNKTNPNLASVSYISSQSQQISAFTEGVTSLPFLLKESQQDHGTIVESLKPAAHFSSVRFCADMQPNISYGGETDTNKSTPLVNEQTFSHMTSCSEAAGPSERLDDIISQLKRSVLKPKRPHLPTTLSESEEILHSPVTEEVPDKELSLIMKGNDDNRKRKRTPSKKVLENLEFLHKHKMRKYNFEGTAIRAVIVDDIKLPINVKEIRKSKLKRTLGRVCADSVRSKQCSVHPTEVIDKVEGTDIGQDIIQNKLKAATRFLKGRKSEGNFNPVNRNVYNVDNKLNVLETDTKQNSAKVSPDVAKTSGGKGLETCVESLMKLVNQPSSLRSTGTEKIRRNNDPAQCPICCEFYSSNITLTRHMRIHNLVRPYTCPVCNKSFVQKITMKVHMRLHSGERPHQCFICGRSFAQKSNMETHVRRHLGVRPYKCNLCSKGFSDKGSLGEHMKTHTGEQPYLCNICGKSFSQRANMRTHVSKHQTEKLFVCRECDKSFKNEDSFMKHMNIHNTDFDV